MFEKHERWPELLSEKGFVGGVTITVTAVKPKRKAGEHIKKKAGWLISYDKTQQVLRQVRNVQKLVPEKLG